MKTAIAIGLVVAAAAIVAAVMTGRDNGSEPVAATVGATGGRSFLGEGDGATAAIDLPSGEYRVYGACGADDGFAVTLVDGGERTNLLRHTGSVVARIPRGAALEVACAGRWWVEVADDPLP